MYLTVRSSYSVSPTLFQCIPATKCISWSYPLTVSVIQCIPATKCISQSYPLTVSVIQCIPATKCISQSYPLTVSFSVSQPQSVSHSHIPLQYHSVYPSHKVYLTVRSLYSIIQCIPATKCISQSYPLTVSVIQCIPATKCISQSYPLTVSFSVSQPQSVSHSHIPLQYHSVYPSHKVYLTVISPYSISHSVYPSHKVYLTVRSLYRNVQAPTLTQISRSNLL